MEVRRHDGHQDRHQPRHRLFLSLEPDERERHALLPRVRRGGDRALEVRRDDGHQDRHQPRPGSPLPRPDERKRHALFLERTCTTAATTSCGNTTARPPPRSTSTPARAVRSLWPDERERHALFPGVRRDGHRAWTYDGTTATKININAGTGGSDPDNLTNVGETLYFTAADGTDRELWKYDGTTATKIDINPARQFDPRI